MKLSDTQLLILSSASQRADHAALLPANLKGSAAKKVVDRLLNEKLLQELRAKDDMPVWRRDDDKRYQPPAVSKLYPVQSGQLTTSIILGPLLDRPATLGGLPPYCLTG